jgi:hypothetical protein
MQVANYHRIFQYVYLSFFKAFLTKEDTNAKYFLRVMDKRFDHFLDEYHILTAKLASCLAPETWFLLVNYTIMNFANFGCITRQLDGFHATHN